MTAPIYSAFTTLDLPNLQLIACPARESRRVEHVTTMSDLYGYLYAYVLLFQLILLAINEDLLIAALPQVSDRSSKVSAALSTVQKTCLLMAPAQVDRLERAECQDGR